MNTIDGALSRARLKSRAIRCSDAPTHLLVTEAAETG